MIMSAKQMHDCTTENLEYLSNTIEQNETFKMIYGEIIKLTECGLYQYITYLTTDDSDGQMKYIADRETLLSIIRVLKFKGFAITLTTTLLNGRLDGNEFILEYETLPMESDLQYYTPIYLKIKW